MPEEPKRDRLWLGLCLAFEGAVDVTLNKYSSILSLWCVLAIWAVPAIFFVVWAWRVENTRNWVKTRFSQHPVSYIVMFLILIPFGWQATAAVVAKWNAPKSVPPTTGQIAAAQSKTEVQQNRSVAPPHPNRPNTHPQSQSPSPTPRGEVIVSGNGNSGNFAGVNNGSQTFTQYGAAQPPPQLTGLTSTEVGPKQIYEMDTDQTKNPGVLAKFKVERPFANPIFLVTCDRPWVATDGFLTGLTGFGPARFAATNLPNVVAISLSPFSQLSTDDEISIVVRSSDSARILVKSVQGYIEPVRTK